MIRHKAIALFVLKKSNEKNCTVFSLLFNSHKGAFQKSLFRIFFFLKISYLERYQLPATIIFIFCVESCSEETLQEGWRVRDQNIVVEKKRSYHKLGRCVGRLAVTCAESGIIVSMSNSDRVCFVRVALEEDIYLTLEMS